MIKEQQWLDRIYIKELKGLKDIEIKFNTKKLTALMGVNGVGKSTILHALACCYKPIDPFKYSNYKFSSFFVTTTYASWKNSHFEIDYHIFSRGNTVASTTLFNKKTDRWNPRYENRPSRNITYLGVDTALPTIEKEKQSSFITLSKSNQNTENTIEILRDASYILQIEYDEFTSHSSKKGKQYVGVSRNRVGNYTSFSMGAGEQRVFKILEALYNATNYSLLLIDEIDILMHTSALKRLIETIYNIQIKKNLQIIFTTHSQVISELSSIVDINYINKLEDKFFVSPNITNFNFYNLTGNSKNLLHIFVEDNLSKSIVEKICDDLGCKISTIIGFFGSSQNAFTILGSEFIQNKDLKNLILILDGDVYQSDGEKLQQIDKKVVGNFNQYRQKILSMICQFSIPRGHNPESFIREIILNESKLDNEIIKIMRETIINENKHDYFNQVKERLNYTTDVFLTKVIDIASKTESWKIYTDPVRDYIKNKLIELEI